MSRASPAKRQFGFTLIEAMVVVSITGMLLAIGLPELANFSARRAVSAQANSLASALRLARAESVKRGLPVTVCPSLAPEAPAPACSGGPGDWARGWIVFSDAGVIGSLENGDRIVQVQPPFTNSGGITSASAGGGVAVTFFPTGIAIGGQRDFSVMAKSGAVTETVEFLSVRLCTDPTGGARTLAYDQSC